MNIRKLLCRAGLKSEIITVTTSVIVLTTVASTIFFYVKTRSILFENVFGRGIAICTNLSSIAKNSILTRNKTELEEPLTDITRYADVVYVVITDSRGKTLAEKITEKLPDTADMQQMAMQTQQPQSSFSRDSHGNLIYNFCCPVMAKKTYCGAIRVGLSLRDITAKLNDMLQGIIALTVAVVGCGILVSINFVRFIMKPVEQMVQAATKITEGDLTQTVEVQSHDELGRFAQQFNAMTTALKVREQQLEESYQELAASEERYRVFIQNTSESIWCFEPKNGQSYPDDCSEDLFIQHLLRDSIVVECNDAMAKIYNAKRREDLLGRTLCDFLSPTDPERIEHFRAFIRNGYALTDTERHYPDQQGQTKTFLTNFLGTTDNGRLLRVWIIQRDITDIKRAEELQIQLFAKIQGTNQELREFAYVASHDLKAPLRGIKTLAEWISKDYADKFDDAAREQFKLLINRVDRMHNLIDGILQYSRVGRVQETPVEVNLNEIVVDVIDSVAPPSNIEIVCKDNLPIITFEEIRIRQVFQNLISNAVKYMDKPQGKISIGCDGDNLCWKFYVTDNGPGIDEKYYEKIFKIFQTLTPRDEYESTGVGLTIVKKIIEMYGGKVWVESKVGQGSTFFFTVLKKQNASSDILTFRPAWSVEAGNYLENKMKDTKYKILLIEDNIIDQMAFKRLVENEKLPYDCSVAGSVSHAKQILTQSKFDVIICDYSLGDGTAFDVFDLVKNTPFIFVTGMGDEGIAVKAYKAGAADYLIKDHDRNYLKTVPITIENVIHHQQTEDRLRLLSGAIMSTEDAVYITDIENKIIFVNRAFCKIYGYAEIDVLGQDSQILWRNNNSASSSRCVFQTASSSRVKFYHRRKDGTLLPVSLSRAIIKDVTSKNIAVVSVAHDITEQILIEGHLSDLTKQMQKQKSDEKQHGGLHVPPNAELIKENEAENEKL